MIIDTHTHTPRYKETVPASERVLDTVSRPDRGVYWAVNWAEYMEAMEPVDKAIVFNIAREARMDDGLLDVFVFKGLGFPYAARHLVKIVTQRHMQDPHVVYRRARHIEVQTEWAVPVQVDGDPIATTPVTVRVVPHALRILVPPSAPSSLFTFTM